MSVCFRASIILTIDVLLIQGDAYDTFISFAKKTESVAFAQTTSAEVAAAAGLEAPDTLAVVKNFAGEIRNAIVIST